MRNAKIIFRETGDLALATQPTTNAHLAALNRRTSLLYKRTVRTGPRCLLLALAFAANGCASTAHRHPPRESSPTSVVTTSPIDLSVNSENSQLSEGSKLIGNSLPPTPVSSDVIPVAHLQDTGRQDTGRNVVQPAGPTPVNELESTPRSMTLADFESMAMTSNPTISQLAATTQKAAGFRQQVSLRANPTVGYQGTQIADQGTDQHVAFVEQAIVTGGKLALNNRVMNEALRTQLFELEAQKYRVQTDVRMKFYAALAAQQQVALTTDFQGVGKQGFEIAELRKRAMEASQVEVLQAKIQMNQIDLAKQQAEVAYAAAWRELVAVVGNPQLPRVTLEGQLDTPVTSIDWDQMRNSILEGSPEYLAAQTRVRQARINLERHGVQAIPNVTVQMAGGVDNGTNSGMMNLQVGAPIPVFNKNQGNIAAARAEYCRAMLEASRIENAIQARLGEVSNSFDSALAAVIKYQSEILPSARETLTLAEQAYKAGEFSFLEVLIVRRTYFESNLQLLQSQTQLAQAHAQVNGFLLTGGLEPTVDFSGDDSLRGLTFSQQ
jgi:outer membrane protein, heavy metal efflux system